ncbi:hypothetical protein LEP1GSC036_1001 [Leptospira weilii str. 2006001853]|uniref:Uncharacterized protein n=1 Tax=Leptospira weilii str. 2006001853 TaxID=1001589 RepID=A0A828YX68_9LEPT|nr:hypothetical protein LEP1GSC036_1742 [Leptospira weilii str. 2006001853]EKR64631.1 hypothetical protein LEP1GSC036_3384 [Leptospira weilii str. 2006001853]EKR66176.1 hypothetical protein LEP1GSC036_1001 [Leptospira weilii str. 2006001853]QDK22968.1 hypothetical protein FHG67_09755 [Leptospira weilii]QDK27388.1 hypothetical protein FHG68_12480 [Leptospira weilii]
MCETIMKKITDIDDELKTELKALLYNFVRDLKKGTASLIELIAEYQVKISQVFREKVDRKKS